MDSKWKSIREALTGKSKFIFPVVVVAAIAVTVVMALGANSEKQQIVDSMSAVDVSSVTSSEVDEVVIDYESIQLTECKDQDLIKLITDYYTASANGDMDKLVSLVDQMDDSEYITIQEKAKYLEEYRNLEIYTKQGYEEGSYVVFVYNDMVFKGRDIECAGVSTLYVCTNEEGKYYIKNTVLSEDVDNYVQNVCVQEDVTALFNRAKVAYNEVMTQHPEMNDYIKAVVDEVQKQSGVILAQKNEEAKESEAGTESGEATTESGAQDSSEEVASPEVIPADVYATTKSAVNVRASDSEKADKVGKASKGLKVKVLEQRENGWSKVIFEEKEAFIKSEFLNVIQEADGVETAGKVKAKSNVNVRASADKEAESYGILVGGEEADLIATEGEWTKVKYKGQIGYVMSEYLE